MVGEVGGILRKPLIWIPLLVLWAVATGVALFPTLGGFIALGEMVKLVPVPYRLAAATTLSALFVAAVGVAFRDRIMLWLFKRAQKSAGVSRGVLSLLIGSPASGDRETLNRWKRDLPPHVVRTLKFGLVFLRLEPDNRLHRRDRKPFVWFTGPYLSVELVIKAAINNFRAAIAQRRLEEGPVRSAWAMVNGALRQLDIVFACFGFGPGKSGVSSFLKYAFFLDNPASLTILTLIVNREVNRQAPNPDEPEWLQELERDLEADEADLGQDLITNWDDMDEGGPQELTFIRRPVHEPPAEPEPDYNDRQRAGTDRDHSLQALAEIIGRIARKGLLTLVPNEAEDGGARERANADLQIWREIVTWCLLSGGDPWQSLQTVGGMVSTVTPPVRVESDVLEAVERLEQGPTRTLVPQVRLVPHPPEHQRRRIIFWGMGNQFLLDELQQEVRRVFRTGTAFHAVATEIPGVDWAEYVLQVEMAEEEVEQVIPGLTETAEWQHYCRLVTAPERQQVITR